MCWAVAVYTSDKTRGTLQDYIESREKGVSASAAWDDIISVYGDLLEQVSARTKIPVEDLNGWYENAFAAYSLVGHPESQTVREIQGRAIAYEASR